MTVCDFRRRPQRLNFRATADPSGNILGHEAAAHSAVKSYGSPRRTSKSPTKTVPSLFGMFFFLSRRPCFFFHFRSVAVSTMRCDIGIARPANGLSSDVFAIFIKLSVETRLGSHNTRKRHFFVTTVDIGWPLSKRGQTRILSPSILRRPKSNHRTQKSSPKLGPDQINSRNEPFSQDGSVECVCSQRRKEATFISNRPAQFP